MTATDGKSFYIKPFRIWKCVSRTLEMVVPTELIIPHMDSNSKAIIGVIHKDLGSYIYQVYVNANYGKRRRKMLI